MPAIKKRTVKLPLLRRITRMLSCGRRTCWRTVTRKEIIFHSHYWKQTLIGKKRDLDNNIRK